MQCACFWNVVSQNNPQISHLPNAYETSLQKMPTLLDYNQFPQQLSDPRHKHEEAYKCTQLLWVFFWGGG